MEELDPKPIGCAIWLPTFVLCLASIFYRLPTFGHIDSAEEFPIVRDAAITSFWLFVLTAIVCISTGVIIILQCRGKSQDSAKPSIALNSAMLLLPILVVALVRDAGVLAPFGVLTSTAAIALEVDSARRREAALCLMISSWLVFIGGNAVGVSILVDSLHSR